jgi:hypothetical protein
MADSKITMGQSRRLFDHNAKFIGCSLTASKPYLASERGFAPEISEVSVRGNRPFNQLSGKDRPIEKVSTAAA